MFAIRCSLARRWGAIALLAIAGFVSGCGSSQSGQTGSSGKSLVEKVNQDDLYRYEGKGKAKRKEEVSRRERVKLLHEAGNKSE
jgi:hypothetical protein